MLFDNKRRSSLNIIEKNFVVRVLELFSHNVPNHYEDHDETKFAFNFLQLERVFSAKPRLHAAGRFHPVLQLKQQIFVVIKQLLLLISENFMQFSYVPHFDFDCRRVLQEGFSEA